MIRAPVSFLRRAAAFGGVEIEAPLASVLPELTSLDPATAAFLEDWLADDPHLTVLDAVTVTPPRHLARPRHFANHLVEAYVGWALAGGRRAAVEAVPPLPEGVEPLPSPLTSAALDAWANRHHVTPYLCLELPKLARIVGISLDAPGWRRWLDVRTALLFDAGQRYGLALPSRDEIGRALAAIATRVAAALEAEGNAPPPQPPADPRLVPVFRAWRAFRAAEREGTHPPLPEVLRGLNVRGEFQRDPAIVHVYVTWSPCPGSIVELPLEGPDGAPAAPRCRCGAPACHARLLALEWALDQITRPDAPLGRELAEFLAVPAWARALAQLDTLVAPPAEPLGWRLVDEGGLLVPEPVSFRPAKARQGLVLTRMGRDAARALADARDDAVLDVLASGVLVSSRGGHRTDVVEQAVGRMLRLLVGHPHVFVDKEPVSVAEERWGLAVEGTEAGARVRVHDAGRDLSVAEFLAGVVPLAGAGLMIRRARGLVALLPISRVGLAALRQLARAPESYPVEALGQLVATFERIRSVLPVRFTGTLRGEPVEVPERLEVRLSLPAPGVVRAAFRVRPLPGGEALPPGEGPPEPIGIVDGRRVHAPRDLEAERRLHARAWEGLPGEPLADVDLDDPEVVLPWLEHLQRLREGDGIQRFEVTWAGGKGWSVASNVRAGHLRLRAKPARSWFAVEGEAEVDDAAIPLSALLAAVRERRTYVPLGHGRWARLTDTLRAQVKALAHGQQQDEAVELSPVHAPLVDALVQDGARLDAGGGILDLLDRLRKADQAEMAVPSGLKAELRPYQLEGFRFLARLAAWAPGAFLADDMGLGKTVQALALLLHRAAEGPGLVVAPTSVGFNWVREAERFAPDLRVRVFRGAGRRDVLVGLGPGDLVVASYDLVQRDAAALAEVPFATVILDEAQALKNAGTRRHEAVAGLKRGFTVALTGTPVENRLDELWALSSLVVPGLFGSARDFRTTWAAPVERSGDAEVRAALSRRLRPFLLRRTKASVAPDLPDRTVVDVTVPLEPDERALYESVRRGALVELEHHTGDTSAQQRIRVLAALTALRQVACHPALHDPGWRGSTSKLDRVRELVGELCAEGHKALIFSQFVGHLQRVRAALEADGVRVRYLDGSTPEAARRTEIDAFQRGDGDVFLISLKAGGTGLNLTAATYVLHLDPWWNPAVEDQATDRAHRIGQTRAVTVYRIVAEGTVEEQILKLHEEKRQLVAGVLEGTDAGAALSTDELWSLLAEGPPAPDEEEEAAPSRSRPPEVPVPAAPAAPSAPPPAATVPPAPAAPRPSSQRLPAPPPPSRRSRSAASKTSRSRAPAAAARAPAPPPPAAPAGTGWTIPRFRTELFASIDADVRARRIAPRTATAYRNAVEWLCARPGLENALVNADALETFVLRRTRVSSPKRVMGLRAVRLLRG